ncbi:argininosuccinate lyase [Sporosarcina gallistercoris]|uniref:Argininosuccinate lyase n=1 Tax=Sporosarcina gallistercoris TaxID=2762245 RepID=A0ABR8PLH4_9BACL|nr:argininosuccinate lyase [Sporosarcina gallistercoris]MBD7909021.1 argininosuccinate lyase [Sporosarcina gallistercoris]
MKEEKEIFEQVDGKLFPGQTYSDVLLKPLFELQKHHLFCAMLAVHRAHTIMLAEQSIIKCAEAEQILQAIEEISNTDPATFTYHADYEDLFFLLESKISERIGEELAGKMHIAKSRNDMGEAMYRIVLREHLQATIGLAKKLASTLLSQAEHHVETIMPAHTHTQPAQPTTLGHYLVAIYDGLCRDIERLERARRTVNQSPMGAAAITTTGFSISRERMVSLLGFDGMIENSYDAIGAGDYLLEAAQSLISLMTNIGRWVQELLRMASKEVGLLRVSDAYVQISSIMPQKRNPVSLEHARSLASSSLAEGLAVLHMIHNTPFGDINDTEDDLQPHLYKGFEKANRVLKLLNAVMITMEFNKERAHQQARDNMITITELADVLAREYDISFRKAHSKAALVAKKANALQKELYDIPIRLVNEWLKDVALSEVDWQAIINPAVFIERRRITGGPNPDTVRGMIAKRKC